jgi:hypothetical protein
MKIFILQAKVVKALVKSEDVMNVNLFLFFASDLSRKTEGMGPMTSWQPR